MGNFDQKMGRFMGKSLPFFYLAVVIIFGVSFHWLYNYYYYKTHRVVFLEEQVSIGITESANLEIINMRDIGLKWYSSNESIVRVDQEGNIYAMDSGEATITAVTMDDKSEDSCIVVVHDDTIHNQEIIPPEPVNDAPVSGISFDKNEISMSINSSFTLNANVLPANAANKKVIWSSSDESTIYVDENGYITAFKKGTAVITATTVEGNFKASVHVIADDFKIPVKSVSLSKNTITINIHKTTTLSAAVMPENANNKTVMWKSSNPKVATVAQDGTIVSKGIGTTTISVMTQDGNKTAECQVTVKEDIVNVYAVLLEQSTIQIAKGKNFSIRASVSPNHATNKNLNYTSKDSSIAVVNKNGMITGVGYGVTNIIVSSAENANKTATFTVAVVPRNEIIDISDKSYSPYLTNLQLYYEDTNTSRHTQYFAITNLGQANETLYFSTSTKGTYKTNSLSEEQKNDLLRTLVLKISKNTLLNNPKSSERQVMYLKNSGHGQGLYVDRNDNMWIGSNGFVYQNSAKNWWSKSNSVMRIKFSANALDSNFSPNLVLYAKDNYNQNIDSHIHIDEDNRLVSARNDRNIYIYNYDEFLNNNIRSMYSFRIGSKINDYSPSFQGSATYNGYFYVLRGASKKEMYVECYNFLGELIYRKMYDPGLRHLTQEAEGIQIYNNKIYVGFTHKDANNAISDRLFDIGTFQ